MEYASWLSFLDLGLKIATAVSAGAYAVWLTIYLKKRDQVIVEIRSTEAKTRLTEAQTKETEAKTKLAAAQQQLNESQAKHTDAQSRETEQKTKKVQLETQELELRLRRQVRVSVDIDVMTYRAARGHVLVADVKLTNYGNEATRIPWEGEVPAFYIRQASFGDGDGFSAATHSKGITFRVQSTRNPAKCAKSHLLRAGATESLTFAAQIDGPGLYLLAFRGATDERERQTAKGHGIEMPGAWTAKRYVWVDDPDPGSVDRA